jgi:hypothetical protein
VYLNIGQFDSVAVGASLDDSGPRAEYIRKGTDWAVVEQNRQDMLRICPEVDFYISPTLSIMNAWHLPDFHRDWVERGLIRAQDLNVNILQDPPHYRIDIATIEYKQRLATKYLIISCGCVKVICWAEQHRGLKVHQLYDGHRQHTLDRYILAQNT